jgi:hypothetical protein
VGTYISRNWKLTPCEPEDAEESDVGTQFYQIISEHKSLMLRPSHILCVLLTSCLSVKLVRLATKKRSKNN